jgi:hypothetical protein
MAQVELTEGELRAVLWSLRVVAGAFARPHSCPDAETAARKLQATLNAGVGTGRADRTSN